MIPRGIRNKNPGNIERSDKFTWVGEIREFQSPEHRDERFCVFKTPEWGLRAMMKLLINYNQKHNINTLKSALERYAPATENKTKDYISAVARWADINPKDEWDFTQYMFLVPVVKAMVRFENGTPSDEQIKNGASKYWWYSDITYQNAYELAAKGRITSHTMNEVPLKKAEPEPVGWFQKILNFFKGK